MSKDKLPPRVLLRSPRRSSIDRIRNHVVQCSVGVKDWDLSYQKCRFCDAGLGDVTFLWKFSVRHYICDACRTRVLARPLQSFRA